MGIAKYSSEENVRKTSTKARWRPSKDREPGEQEVDVARGSRAGQRAGERKLETRRKTVTKQ